MLKKLPNQIKQNESVKSPGSPIERHSDPKKKNMILPKAMSYKAGAHVLMEADHQDQIMVKVIEPIDAYPTDAAHAANRVLEEHYNGILEKDGRTFGGRTPETINVPVGIKRSIVHGVEIKEQEDMKISIGKMSIPGILESTLEFVLTTTKDGMPICELHIEAKKKDKDLVYEFVDLVRNYVKACSIYRHSAIKVEFPKSGDDVGWNDFSPQFIDLDGVRREQLIFDDELTAKIDHNLFTLITNTKHCKQAKVPLKRGVVLGGMYGVGKTLTAMVAAKLAVQNEWTFLYVNSPDDLPEAIKMSHQYGRVVVFCEDIDAGFAKSRGARDQTVNDILNMADGIDTKGNELVLVLTTNNEHDVEKAFMRPGRTDFFCHVTPPDRKAAIKLMRQYGGEHIAASEDLTECGKLMDGQIPAFIREAVERSKLGAISRLSPDDEAYNLCITAQDLETSCKSLEAHMRLVKPQIADNRSDLERAAELLAKTLVTGLIDVVKNAIFFWRKKDVSDTTIESDTRHA